MNTVSPTISVVIPLYNKQDEILRTLESVVTQTQQPLEVLVINDGSTDNSATVVRDAIATRKLFSKIKLVMQPNGGVSRARNTGIRMARGTHIAFLDADDCWLPRYIETLHCLVRNYPEARAQGTAYFKISGETLTKPKVRSLPKNRHTLLMHNYFEVVSRGDLPLMPSSLCAEKKLLLAVGGFPEDEAMGEDQHLLARLALNTPFAYCFDALLQYHLDANNRACVRNLPREELPFSQRLYQEVQNNEIDRKLHTAIVRYNAAHLLYLSEQLLAAGDSDCAARLISDPRTRLLPLKKIRAHIRLLNKRLLRRIRDIPTALRTDSL